ncbi:MAG: M14 family metallopeptidase [Chitinophagaceae bacterium]
MRKYLVALPLFLLSFFFVNAQLKSPEEFLGYKIGTHYTPHWKIVSYFQYVANTLPSTVKLLQYGETNEGRPLLATFIGTAENIQNLESIRMNNLRLANQAKDKAAAMEDNTPAIVWLSYNVHGNETSSSEASMLTLFDVANPANTKTKEWLKNTLVVIDPCINPDGRDRYVNWFNSIVGKQYNPRLDAREHREPWPGGRTNHYNFDLNRDWAWQTQVESQQRLKLYNQWLPQVHVDFHEQGINNPYYFAPAAQPYHESVTQWERDFQVTIGKNNAKYFDANGWLFFTKEVFDLFYPSYGDSYPIFNGGIGMTYEQGGGGAGGLGVYKEEGDTLTLVDRVMHHYTTSLSTIEISSLNASKLVKEFHKFFNDAVSNGAGEYKSYVIKNGPQDGERVNALLDLLDKNNIQYSAGSGSGKGYSYGSGKEETFSISQNDIVINAAQPRAVMVKVLFEPKTKLVDSSTYDITAWALPYVYGLTAYASKEKVNATGAYTRSPDVVNTAADVYGYVIRWQGVQTAKAVGELLQKGIILRIADNPFEVSGQQFDRGSVLVLKSSNNGFASSLWNVVTKICNDNKIKLNPVTTGFVDKGYDFGSNTIRVLKAPKVALLTGEGTSSNATGEVWHFFEKQLNYPLTLINANDIGRADWKNIDVLIMADGTYRFLNDKSSAEDFKDWVNRGGRVVALENAVAQLSNLDWINIKQKKADDDNDDKKVKDPYSALKKYETRERDNISTTAPGSILKVDLDNTHPLAFGYPSYYYSLKMDGNVYEFIKDGGWNVGVIKKESPLSGFIGNKLKEKFKDGLLFGIQYSGRGSVTFLADNVVFRNFWENGKLMLCNAIFMTGR